MQQVPIQAIPNQSFSILLDSNQWGILIKTVQDITVVSLTLNGNDLIDGAKAVAGSLIIPAQYQEAGNFLFVTANQALPYYTLFNTSQSFIYVSAAALAVYRTPPPSRITASYFNPIAALPQRFAPQGY